MFEMTKQTLEEIGLWHSSLVLFSVDKQGKHLEYLRINKGQQAACSESSQSFFKICLFQKLPGLSFFFLGWLLGLRVLQG